MKRLLLLPFLLLALTACGGSDVQDPGAGSTPPASTASATKLVVTVWVDPSTAAAPAVTTVDKAPGATAKDFAAPDPTAACTMIFPVWIRLSASRACIVSRIVSVLPS